MFTNFAQTFLDATRRVLPTLSGQVLENRGTTIGASDVAGCARRVIAGKRRKETIGDATAMRFLNGHTREVSLGVVHREIAKAEGLHLFDQVRVTAPDSERIRAHLDRIWSDAADLRDATRLHVMEEKNVEALPEEPRESWLRQLQFQMGLLAEAYPEALVTGSVFVTSHSGVRHFGPLDLDWGLYETLLERARTMLLAIDTGATPDPEPSEECAWCGARGSCPVWGDTLPDPLPEGVVAVLRKYAANCRVKNEAGKRQQELKEKILRLLWGKEPPKRFRGEVAPGVFLDFQVRNGRKSVDLKALEAEYPEVFAEVVREGNPYDVLTVQTED